MTEKCSFRAAIATWRDQLELVYMFIKLKMCKLGGKSEKLKKMIFLLFYFFTLMQYKKYTFSVKIWYEHVAPWVTWGGIESQVYLKEWLQADITVIAISVDNSN
jgi:hypothetical protein